MAISQADIIASSEWVDAIAANPSLADTDVYIQNAGRDVIDLVFGGASAPTHKSGLRLAPLDSVCANATNIWIRGGGKASVALV